MNKILCKISDDDAKKLYETIIEVEASHDLYEIAIKRIDYSPEAFKIVLDYYMHALKIHKILWKDMINKYVKDEENINLDLLRFDVVKQCIFQINCINCNQMECSL